MADAVTTRIYELQVKLAADSLRALKSIENSRKGSRRISSKNSQDKGKDFGEGIIRPASQWTNLSKALRRGD